MNSYIKLFRKMLEWEWYHDTNVKILFLHCLLKANYKAKKWQGRTIEAGSFITSLPNLATELNISVQQVRTALNKLKSTGEITDKSTNEYRVISIINWEEYQDNQQAEQQTGNRQVAGEQQADNSYLRKKELKEVKNKELNTLAQSDKKSLQAEASLSKYFLPIISKAEKQEYAYFTQDLVNSWFETFGEMFVIEQVRLAYAWSLSNKNKQKTAKGINRFMYAWLERAWNEHKNKKAPTKSFEQVNAEEFEKAFKDLEQKLATKESEETKVCN